MSSVFDELVTLRAQLETVTRERDEARREAAVVLGAPAETCAKHGATTVATKAGQRWRVACAQCQDDALTTAERARDEAIERAHRSGLLFDDARKQTTEARADAARLREALKRMLRRHSFRAIAGGCCLACENAEAALAPSAEPTPRDTRVAEALEGLTAWLSRWRHAITIRAEGAAQAWDELERLHNTGIAVVAKAVKP